MYIFCIVGSKSVRTYDILASHELWIQIDDRQVDRYTYVLKHLSSINSDNSESEVNKNLPIRN